jgi:hypothetical protein
MNKGCEKASVIKEANILRGPCIKGAGKQASSTELSLTKRISLT